MLTWSLDGVVLIARGRCAEASTAVIASTRSGAPIASASTDTREQTHTQRQAQRHAEQQRPKDAWMERWMNGWAGKRRGQFTLTSTPSKQENRLFIRLCIATTLLPAAHTADCAVSRMVDGLPMLVRPPAPPSVRPHHTARLHTFFHATAKAVKSHQI